VVAGRTNGLVGDGDRSSPRSHRWLEGVKRGGRRGGAVVWTGVVVTHAGRDGRWWRQAARPSVSSERCGGLLGSSGRGQETPGPRDPHLRPAGRLEDPRGVWSTLPGRCGVWAPALGSGWGGEELGQFLAGFKEAEGLAGSSVEFAFDLGQVGGGVHAEVGAFGHPLA
jgi:hypothetical protein